MKKKAKLAKLLTGKIYTLDHEDFNNFIPGNHKIIEDEYEAFYKLDQGNIIPNPEFNNERIIFDLIGNSDYYGAAFSGFLYPDMKFMGKVKWIKDANLSDNDFRGCYKKISKKGIVLYGKWTESANETYNAVVVLK